MILIPHLLRYNLVTTMKLLLGVCLLSFLEATLGCYADPLTVTVEQGQLKGTTFTTRNGRKVMGFLGIPFAKPPVGRLRFRSPEPPLRWSGLRDASKDGNPCVQNNLLDYKNRNVTFGNEDCLYLNVFTPTLSKTAGLPVMVYIYGGGFTSGSPTSDLYGPQYILDHDVVLAVINYRLGPLGFLSTEDNQLPGNYGLKDQTEALRWIQKNIKVFGGNKNSVTIFGNSAGSGSVHLHMMSPLSKGLFHAAISQSGTGLCQWAAHPPGSNRKTAVRVAREFNCPTSSSNIIAECLRKVPAYDITALVNKYLVFDLDPIVIFPPTVEGNTKGAFLTNDPWTMTTSVPWIAGMVSQEGSMRTSSLTRGGEEGVARVAKLNEDYKKLMPATLMVEYAKNPVEISEQVKKFYFGKSEISEAKLSQLINMYSDSWFTYCIAEAVRRHTGPVYHYYLSYKGNKTVAFLFGNDKDDLGVCHVDELIYLFPLNAYFPNRSDTPQDIRFSKELVEMWTNFARFRNPTPQRSLRNWEPVSTPAREYLHMSNNGYEMGDNLLKERFEFWQNLPFRKKPEPAESSINKTRF